RGRGTVLVLKQSEFVDAANAIGVSPFRLVRSHLIPNVLGPVIVAETLAMPGYILAEAFLSFIGLGVTSPMPSWGGMISDGYRALRAHPEVALFPAAALAVTVMALNFAGDGLRDALDPRSG
ncbi:MAG: ABC transporter permease, partial [SAR202 cluster bacterium]|nr:ABC transporter permease [SAR202 cluster bacterium]